MAKIQLDCELYLLDAGQEACGHAVQESFQVVSAFRSLLDEKVVVCEECGAGFCVELLVHAGECDELADDLADVETCYIGYLAA